ncbi:PREDICTED: lanC-like protein 2 [Amphimedon queenslandica]|uniref:LanC-like protein 2 n=1 Tax=Amphimedon queenslandica TaxID=400682 RepID=A0A1X7V1F7_AMPQE|nr:PREDICTED: lanC-like protein 2 [Amphimedon queenslandica]|eukprot:XP_019851239.1 PREDICTED: lanC-like protein 2 [Amphimedon queenslandica]
MAEKRYLGNPWLSDFTKEGCNSPSKAQETLKLLKPKILTELESTLKRIDAHYKSSASSDQSVYTGTGGLAFLHLHLATSIFSDDKERAQYELSLCLSFIEPSLAHLKTHRKTFLCGGAGPLAIAAVCYHKLSRSSESLECIRRLCSMYSENKREFERLPSELLYGQTGYLYALLFVSSFIPGSIDIGLMEEISQLILSSSTKDSEFPLMYTWHEKHYLGAAHGLAGILTVLMQAIHLKSISSHIDAIKSTIDKLLTLQFSTGNFPSSLESCSNDKLVQWCHGAPGFVHMLGMAYKVFHDEKYLIAMEKCGEVIWERGLLLKGFGLCHGTAGNAYSLLSLYQSTGQDYHLHRAIKFCEWCMTETEAGKLPDRPFSLFEGIAGKVIFLADIYYNSQKCHFPALGFDSK